MDQINIIEVTPESPQYEAVNQLRNEILRIPLGLELTADDLEAEKNDMILAAESEDQIVGCILLHPVNDMTVRFRQMAIDTTHQRQGIGTKLLQAAEEKAWKGGFERIIIHARDTAANFYLGAGYEVDGEDFVEVGLPHKLMVKYKAS